MGFEALHQNWLQLLSDEVLERTIGASSSSLT